MVGRLFLTVGLLAALCWLAGMMIYMMRGSRAEQRFIAACARHQGVAVLSLDGSRYCLTGPWDATPEGH